MNPGVLTYLPTEFTLPDIPQETDDALNEAPRSMETISFMRKSIANRATEIMKDLGEDFIPISSGHLQRGPWTVLMMPVRELQFEDLPEAYRSATRVTHNKTKHEEVWVAHFAKGLPACANLPGLEKPIQAGAHVIVYRTSIHGAGRAEILAKRHLGKKKMEEQNATSSSSSVPASTTEIGRAHV